MTSPALVHPTSRAPSGSSAISLWITAGALLFIVALAGSAAVVPRLRVLHFFQALLYVAVAVMARRGSAMAFGAGTVVAIAWNGLQLFITHNMQAGARLLWSYAHTGAATRIDTMLVFVGGVGHFILIAASVTAFLISRPNGRAWRDFGLGGLFGLLYMAAIIAAFLPR